MNITCLDELLGKRVVVTADAGVLGYMVAPRHLVARRLAAIGIVGGIVPGHGGDVVWVRQEETADGAEPVAVYCHLNELEFYCDEAVVFAREKAEQVLALENQISGLRLKPFACGAGQ